MQFSVDIRLGTSGIFSCFNTRAYLAMRLRVSVYSRCLAFNSSLFIIDSGILMVELWFRLVRRRYELLVQ